MKKFTADFETCVWLPDETYVWAWAVSEIGNDDNIIIDNNIDSFIEFCKNEKNAEFYFHNLKFDGEFIIYWALTHGFKHVEKKEDITTRRELNRFINSLRRFSKSGAEEIIKTSGRRKHNKMGKTRIKYSKKSSNKAFKQRAC